ncbi:IS5/IS1182 family transposase, partial [Cytobacillus firmus]|nr:IS5/IS1182 family transposase [Cytobacillus firmus]
SIEKYHQSVIEKSNQLYSELLENEIIPEIKRESDEQLSLEELNQYVQKVDEVVTEYDKQIEASSDVIERKSIRSKRKYPKQVRKQ